MYFQLLEEWQDFYIECNAYEIFSDFYRAFNPTDVRLPFKTWPNNCLTTDAIH